MGDKTGFTRGNSDLDYRFLETIYICLISYCSDTSLTARREEFTATKHLVAKVHQSLGGTQAKLLLSEKCFPEHKNIKEFISAFLWLHTEEECLQDFLLFFFLSFDSVELNVIISSD